MASTPPWKLVAPWYRWQRQLISEGRKPWQTRPVFQKFESPDFVKAFARDPQHSLTFTDPEDFVFDSVLIPVARLTSGPFSGRLARLFAPKTKPNVKQNTAGDANLAPTGLRKLYLATHKRFYLVVCELHCYLPGFPTTTADQVCQAGFVVRRRSLQIASNLQKAAHRQADQLLTELDVARAELAHWEQTTPAVGQEAQRRSLEVQTALADGTLATQLSNARANLAESEAKLAQWRDAFSVRATLQGWFAGNFERIGSWQSVEETPADVTETSFSLYPLFPDPKIPDHSAKGRNIYFGVVPTSTLDTDAAGVAQFDSDTTYEIRCFVRRHKVGCPRLKQTPDCHGEIVWSEPTESYRLAPPTDLIGTSNQPVTLRMPDFTELAAQVAALPVKKLAPVRVVHPQSMNFGIDDGKPTGGSVGGFQICFISIPLITIVAMFVLKLFLPIVVFLFGLFFLLRLKFCIPPSLDLQFGVFAKMAALLPKLEANASLNVDVEFPASLGLNFNVNQLNSDLRAAIVIENAADVQSTDLSDFSNVALLPLGVSLNDAKNLTSDDGLPKAEAGLDLTGSLTFEPRVEASASGSLGAGSSKP